MQITHFLSSKYITTMIKSKNSRFRKLEQAALAGMNSMIHICRFLFPGWMFVKY